MPSVANYNIEDNSGANVRIDLNAVFGAIQSNNSENTDLASSKCVAGMWFFNDDSNKILKIRNSGNNDFTDVGNIDSPNLGLLPRSGGTMTGPLLIDNSTSASTPALSFDGDTDLGLFRKSSNILGFSAGGTEQILFDSNGITLQLRNEVRFADADSSNYIAIQSPATVSSNKTITLPVETGTLLTSATSIAVSQLSGSLITLGSTALSQGSTITALAGMHEIAPATNNNYSLGTASLRWSDVFTADLDLSNEGSQNDIDGTWGSYKIQEGEEHLYLLNKRNGKKYKFNLTEIE